jgi:DNA replication protein DnaC
MLTHPLLPKLRQLKLSGMLETLEARTQLAQETALSPTEFLALLLDDEIERREQGRLLRQEREAGFESPKRLSQFDFAAAPTVNRSEVLERASCQFVARHENWLVYGPTGTGKSHLATAIGFEAIKQGMRVVAGPTHHLVADLLGSRGTPLYGRRLRRLVACDLLILDDFGLRNFALSGAEEIYEVIRLRYEKGSILLTSNRAPSEWPAVFGDGLIASAALDRLTHHAHLTCIEGESYRQRRRKGDLVPSDPQRVEALRNASASNEAQGSKAASGGKG